MFISYTVVMFLIDELDNNAIYYNYTDCGNGKCMEKKSTHKFSNLKYFFQTIYLIINKSFQISWIIYFSSQICRNYLVPFQI